MTSPRITNVEHVLTAGNEEIGPHTERGTGTSGGGSHAHPFLKLSGGVMTGSIIPTSQAFADLGDSTRQWGSIWTLNLKANVLDDAGQGFIDIDTDFLPNSPTLTYDLGSSTRIWAELWVKDIKSGANKLVINSSADMDILASDNIFIRGDDLIISSVLTSGAASGIRLSSSKVIEIVTSQDFIELNARIDGGVRIGDESSQRGTFIELYELQASNPETISAISVANPTVITTSFHIYKDGAGVTISGSDSTPSIDGHHTITFISNTSYSIPVNVTVAGTTGSSTFSELPGDAQTNGVRLYLRKKSGDTVSELSVVFQNGSVVVLATEF